MKKRIESFDAFRGLLLVAMIAAHSFLHLFSGVFPDILFHFVSTGFVLFVGILLGKVLINKKTNKQIFIRGLKILAIFLLLNVPFWIMSGTSIFRIFITLFVGTPEHAAFEILVPIAYLICLTPILKKIPITIGILSALILLLILDVFEFFPFVLKFLLIGFIGFYVSQTQLFIKESIKSKKLSSLSFFISLVCILIFVFLGNFWVLQSIFTLSLFFFITPFIKNSNQLKIFGKYSLFLYLIHIFIIKAVSIFFTTKSMTLVLLILLLITALCAFIIKLTDLCIKNSPNFKRLFWLIFH